MKQDSSLYSKALIYLILAQITVGINIVCAKYLLTTISTPVLLLVRFSIGSLVLLPLHLLTPAKKPIHRYFLDLSKKDWLFVFGQAISAGFLFNLLMLMGLHYTDANVAGIIASALPAIISLMSFIFLKTRVTLKTTLCISFATFGLLIIACSKFQGEGVHHSLLGDVIVFLSLLPEAAYYILYRYHPIPLPIFLICFLLNLINALLALIWFLVLPEPYILSLTTWLVLFILGLGSGAFFIFWYFGSKGVDSMTASLSTAVMPVATVILAWIFLGEELKIEQFLGMGLVMLSIGIQAK